MRAYKLLARPVFSYGNGAWAIRKKEEWRLTPAEKKFLRENAGYLLLLHKRIELITEEIKKAPTAEYLQQY
jgi:hypothetical protein